MEESLCRRLAHYEPGGFSVRDVLHILHAIGAGTWAPIVGADLVEFNPVRDPNGMTAMVGAKFYKEILGRMLGSAPPVSAVKNLCQAALWSSSRPLVRRAGGRLRRPCCMFPTVTA